MSKYKTFTGPFGKVFLGAVLTYQIIYWCWLKLEMDESKLEKNGMLWNHSNFTHGQTLMVSKKKLRALRKRLVIWLPRKNEMAAIDL